MKSDPENLVALVGKVVTWLVKQRWKKVAWATVSCLKFAAKIRARAGAAVLMQKVIRMHLSRSVNKPRYVGMRQLKVLAGNLQVMQEVIAKLPKNKDKFEKVVEELKAEFDKGIKEIKSNPNIDRAGCKKIEDDLSQKCDKQLVALKKEQEKQKLAEEVRFISWLIVVCLLFIIVLFVCVCFCLLVFLRKERKTSFLLYLLRLGFSLNPLCLATHRRSV